MAGENAKQRSVFRTRLFLDVLTNTGRSHGHRRPHMGPLHGVLHTMLCIVITTRVRFLVEPCGTPSAALSRSTATSPFNGENGVETIQRYVEPFLGYEQYFVSKEGDDINDHLHVTSGGLVGWDQSMIVSSILSS